MLVALERDRSALDRLDGAIGPDARAISVVTVSELLHGVHRADRARRASRLAFVEHVVASVEAVPITTRIARVHARLWADLAARGEVMGAHDLWIAATAQAQGWALATFDSRGFDRIDGFDLIALPDH